MNSNKISNIFGKIVLGIGIFFALAAGVLGFFDIKNQTVAVLWLVLAYTVVGLIFALIFAYFICVAVTARKNEKQVKNSTSDVKDEQSK